MAINTLEIVQDNKVWNSNLLSICNPLSFICQAFYSGQSPDWIYCDLSIDGVKVGTYKAIAYKDLTGTLRQFIFIADDVVRGLMAKSFGDNSLSDFNQSSTTLQYVDNLTKEITITFRDPANDLVNASFLFDACLAASQYTDVTGANMLAQYTNQTDVYYCAKGGVCNVYFYNDNVNNVLSINGLVETFYAIDANDDVFTDANNDKYLI